MLDDRSFVSAQYQQTDPLQARLALHRRFSTNPVPWTTWLFDQLPFTASGSLLEVGCGSGDLWADNQQRWPQEWSFVVSDLRHAMIALVQERLERRRPFHFLQADAQHLPLKEGRFDLVVANHMLYHVPDLDGALATLARALKPGGWLVAATNGAGHMLELFQLMNRILPGTWFAGDEKNSAGVEMTFTRDTGGSLIGRYFENVEVRRQPNHLQVTEAEPLMAYILSLFPGREAIDEQAIKSLMGYLDDQLEHEGGFHITKDAGIILGRKP